MTTSAQLSNILLRRNLRALAMAAMLLVVPILILMPTAQAQTFTVLHTFTGGPDGENPYAPVTLDSTGSLYGQTVSSYDDSQAGTIYKVTPRSYGWTFAPLSHGGGWGGVTIGPNGSLYGTGHVAYDTIGVFNVQPPPHFLPNPLSPWIQTSLYALEVGSEYYTAGVVFDRAGNIYGTTSGDEAGTVYELSPSDGGWTETVLHYFGEGLDGFLPLDSLVLDAAGNIYGTTEMGGDYGLGTVFELSYSPESGWTESFVYSFTGGEDAEYPFGGLIFDSSGNLYGATAGTYSPGGIVGTVFRLTPSGGSWTFSTIYSFGATGQGDQCGPRGTPAMDGAGNLYDTTACLGAYSLGSVFKLTPANGTWSYTTLHDFTGRSDGGYPQAGVTLDANGNIYGTAAIGGSPGGDCGSNGCGVVWEITP